MVLKRFFHVLLLGLFFCGVSGFSSSSEAATTLRETVTQALDYSERIKALAHNNEALAYDLHQVRGAYFPSVDLYFGYGLEQYSDEITRQTGADPADTDWDSKGVGSLRITQKIYDGGETGHQISIQKALLNASQFRMLSVTQSVALEAIAAHLNVYRQQELVALAEDNLGIHKEIYQLLAEGERAGFVSIADVSQIQARLARAESILFDSNADLDRAVANYTRLVGAAPEALTGAPPPEITMDSLEAALHWMEKKNPELSALEAELDEAEAKVALSRSGYKPKINLELSSQYNNQLEGETSWKNSNEAMLVMRWNLFDGGKDTAKHGAAVSRKSQVRSDRNTRLYELRETTSSVWTDFILLQHQKEKYQEAVDFSRETFDAYLKQFNVGKRDLLDVLSAENDYFQSASKWIVVNVDEKIAAYHLLKLGGELQLSSIRETPEASAKTGGLSKRLSLPSAGPLTQTGSPAPISSGKPPVHPEASAGRQSVGMAVPEAIDREPSSPLYSLKIGPFVNEKELNEAVTIIESLGLPTRRVSERGAVTFIRLLEGVYQADDARARLKVLQQIADSAFVLREGEELALYAGSFRDAAKAAHFSEGLARENVSVTPVSCEVEMQGTVLIAEKVENSIAEEISRRMSQLNVLTTRSREVPSMAE